MNNRDIWILGLHAVVLLVWFIDSKSIDWYRERIRLRRFRRDGWMEGLPKDGILQNKDLDSFQVKISDWEKSISKRNHPTGDASKHQNARRRPRKQKSIFSELDHDVIRRFWENQYRKGN